MAEQMTYRAFDGEEMIYEGTRKGLLEFFHVSHSTAVRKYASDGTLLLGKYRITVSYKEGKFTQCQDELFKFQLRELRKKGDRAVAMEGRLEENIKMLEEKGIKVKIIETEDRESKEAPKRKKKIHYSLEVI